MSLASDEKETPTNSDKEGSNPKPEDAEACQSKPRDKRPTSAISLIKEDFGQFKQDVLNIFKDKDAKTSQVKDKTALNVLKEDLDLFKNEVTTFTGDISGIFWKGLRREDLLKVKVTQNEQRKDEIEREDSFVRKANEPTEQKDEIERENNENDKENEKNNKQDLQSEDSEKEESLERKPQEQKECSESVNDSCKIEDSELEKKSADDSIEIKAHGENGDEAKDDAFELKAQTDTKNPEKELNSEDGWEIVEFEQNERTLNKEAAETGARSDRRDGGAKMSDADVTLAEAELVPRADHLISLSSGVSLLHLRHVIENQQRGEFKDDIWAIKNFAQYLTLDPNTANPELVLSDGNRTARREWSGGRVMHQLIDHMTEHPERFEHCPQVLCREGLLDVVYWEVQWTGGADVGVAYNSLSRRGPAAEGLLGQSESSWSLECNRGSYTPCHCRRRYKSVCPEPFSKTVGVFLDFEAGSLSFFCVSPSSMQHLHTFTATFTEPLYPGFWVWSWGGSVSLRQVELDWERLLQ